MNKSLWYWLYSSSMLVDEAINRWFDVEIISENKNTFFINWNGKSVLFKGTDFWWNSSLSVKISLDKELTYKILEKNNFPIVKSYYLSKKMYNDFNSTDINNFKYPLIIKPFNESHWNWVRMNIATFDELKVKLIGSFKEYDDMIIQEEIKWDEIRILVVKWKIVFAINRVPATIFGDGHNSIEELIVIENNTNKHRWEWYKKHLTIIEIDDEIISYISKQNFTLDSIPTKWEKIQLRWNTNRWTGGTAIDVTDKISDNIKEVCIELCKVFGMSICWVDIITSDYTKTLEESWWIILELNDTPGIWWTDWIESINAWKDILDIIFSEEE